MTDYTQNITFATKDALSTGDPAKVIKGSDIDGEFSEIETASATKLDKYSAVTELTALADADMLSVYDNDATAYKRITIANARPALHAANGCSFFASLNSDFTVSTGTATKIQFDDDSTDGFDLGSVYDASTNHVFTAPANGYYFLTASGISQGMGDGDAAIWSINSSAYSNNPVVASKISHGAPGASYLHCAWFGYLASGTTVWVEFFHNEGVDNDILSQQATQQSSFSGFRVA
jgi:hypothetical protein